MEVLILLVVASLALVGAAILLYARTTRDRTLEHADRLALLPLDEEQPPPRE